MKEQSGGRDVSLDAGSGILIVFIVALHARLIKNEPFSLIHFLGFFMPWFFYKAGMFYKNEEQKLWIYFKNKAKRLGPPYLFIVFTTLFLSDSPFPSKDSILDFLLFVNGAVVIKWFLEAYFIASVLFKIIPKDKLVLCIVAIVLFVLTDILNRYFADTPYTILIVKQVPCALFYMIVGFLLKEKQYLQKHIWEWIGALSLFYLFIIVIYPSNVDMRLQQINYGYFEIAVWGNIVGIILFNNILKALVKYLPMLFIYIGYNSFAYYVLHRPCMQVLGLEPITIGVSDNHIFCFATVLFIVPLLIFVAKKVKLGSIIGVKY